MKSVAAVLCFVAFQLSVFAEELSFTWQEMPNWLIVGRKVEVHLPGNSLVQGKAIAVKPDGLQMQITKVSKGQGKYQKGEGLVSSGEILLLKVNRNRTVGRIVLTSVFVGLAAIGVAGAAVEGGTPTPAAAVMLAAFPVAGYGLGWLIDRKSVTIQVLPEPVVARTRLP